MFKKILVPIDPSEVEFGAKALETGVGLAKQSGGDLRLVAVVPIVGGYVTEFLPPDYQGQVEKQTTERLQDLAKDAGMPAGKATTAIRLGSVYHEVVDEAEAWGADLIVTASHRPTMATYLIGSNAAKIVRHAPCSVMVVRA